MTENQVYAGIVLAGVCASQMQPMIMGIHRRLERDVGVDLPRWADVGALLSSWLFGLAAAIVAGAVLGAESDALGHSWRIGAVWGGLGGVVGPQIWPAIKSAVGRFVKRKGESADGA